MLLFFTCSNIITVTIATTGETTTTNTFTTDFTPVIKNNTITSMITITTIDTTVTTFAGVTLHYITLHDQKYVDSQIPAICES